MALPGSQVWGRHGKTFFGHDPQPPTSRCKNPLFDIICRSCSFQTWGKMLKHSCLCPLFLIKNLIFCDFSAMFSWEIGYYSLITLSPCFSAGSIICPSQHPMASRCGRSRWATRRWRPRSIGPCSKNWRTRNGFIPRRRGRRAAKGRVVRGLCGRYV